MKCGVNPYPNISVWRVSLKRKEKGSFYNNIKRSAGCHTVIRNALNFSSGIFFYRFQSGDFIQTKKVLLLR